MRISNPAQCRAVTSHRQWISQNEEGMGAAAIWWRIRFRPGPHVISPGAHQEFVISPGAQRRNLAACAAHIGGLKRTSWLRAFLKAITESLAVGPTEITFAASPAFHKSFDYRLLRFARNDMEDSCLSLRAAHRRSNVSPAIVEKLAKRRTRFLHFGPAAPPLQSK